MSDRAIATEGEHIGVLGFERRRVADAAQEDIRGADAMALFDEAFNQRLRFAGALSPYDVIAGADDSGEIEILRIEFLRHRRMRLRFGAASASHKCSEIAVAYCEQRTTW